MDSSEEMGFRPSSPHSSSGEGGSFKGTPDTRLTAFSPNESSIKSAKSLETPGTSGPETTPIRYSSLPSRVTAHTDPFVTHSPERKTSQKLSPTAAAFQPFSASGESTLPVSLPGVLVSPNNTAQLPVVSTSSSTQAGVSRTLVVSHGTHSVDLSEIEQWLTKLGKSNVHFFDRWISQAWGEQVLLRFNDIRDSTLVFAHSRQGVTWSVRYLTLVESHLVKGAGSGKYDNLDFQAQVLVSAFTLAPSQPLEEATAERLVRQLLLSHADVYSFQKQSLASNEVYKAMVEFCAGSAAKSAVVKFGSVSLQGIHVTIGPHHPASHGSDFTSPAQLVMDHHRDAGHGQGHADSSLIAAMQDLSLSKPDMDVPASPHGEESQARGPLVGYRVHPPLAMYPIIYHPQLASAVPYILGHGPLNSSQAASSSVPHGVASFPRTPHPDYQYETSPQSILPGFDGPDGRRRNAYRANRRPYNGAANHHNHVEVSRIRDGIDVRTTIMLRNIPNKVDQAMLKRIVDESSWGKYDFMYLRIDFANDCNVGYAFINFVDPLDIIDFVNARGNQRWNCFKSDKVAEISYATIQGKDCLVQKFRNSSVMLEAPHYRPKLYFTLNGPRPDLAGQEEPFPEPDNQSKMKRSCENAEHVGLFTPNAGQHFRDEQRRRRSQYDRGTRLAALEEYNYDTAIDQVFNQQ